jgi:hypothetical protein
MAPVPIEHTTGFIICGEWKTPKREGYTSEFYHVDTADELGSYIADILSYPEGHIIAIAKCTNPTVRFHLSFDLNEDKEEEPTDHDAPRWEPIDTGVDFSRYD